MYRLTVSHRLVSILSIIIVSCLLLLTMSAVTPDKNQAFARCPNGTHKSPSGDCETVIPHAGFPRCPNGFHRSPSGICEQVGSSSSSSSSSDGSGSLNTLSPFSPFAGNSNNNPIPSITSESTPGAQCDQSLWNHVYNPQRLKVVESCKIVTGIIESKRVEADGDYHIRLKLDPQYANLINQANVNGQLGDLVVEPICINRVTQLDAISACQNFRQNIDIPAVGTHVQITGSYVLDKEHGSWAEIHPVTSITKIA
jgi:hypothetical protein